MYELMYTCPCCCVMSCRFGDTDVPDEAKAIYKKLKKQWQQLKTHSLEVGTLLQ
jgi:hypothetical protein